MKQILKESNTVIFNMFYKYVLKTLPLRFFPLKITFSFKKKLGKKSRCYKLVSKPGCEGSEHDGRV